MEKDVNACRICARKSAKCRPCPSCGRPVCENCMDHYTGLCVRCKFRGEPHSGATPITVDPGDIRK